LIRKFISDRSFTPEQVGVITKAFDGTCRDLGLINRDDPIVQLVAEAVIDIALSGEWGSEQIRRFALRRLTFFDAESGAMAALLGDAIGLAGADRGNVQKYNSADRSLAIILHQGFGEEFLQTFERVSLQDNSACARAMRSRMPILIEDVSVDDGFTEYRRIAQRSGFASVASFPLITESEKFIGVLSVHFAKTSSLKESKVAVLNDYARDAAAALDAAFSLRS
jgi:GAF domain-containing protein